MKDRNIILGKDAALNESISYMQKQLKQLGFHIEEHSWLNPVPNVWSVHIRDSDCPLLFTNGKGASRQSALASALGEFFERLNCNYFFADFYLGKAMSEANFVHYPNEKWFALDGSWPDGLLNKELIDHYNPEGTLQASDLIDTNSGNIERGICALPYIRQRDQKAIYFPVNIIGNLYVSNGMSAGNTPTEARVQALSEIFERWVKFKIISESICLPTVPDSVIARYPSILEGINELKSAGYGIIVKDASLGGKYPVINVTLLNPEDQGCFASFGAHPCFEIALERTLTELLQGRGLDALMGFSPASFDSEEIASPHNIETHFIDSSGVISWEFLRETADYDFADWDFRGSTQEEFGHLCDAIHAEGRDIYISEYTHLGMYGCRIIVPAMSEIYPPEDLEWDNNNAGVKYREAIFNLPALTTEQLTELLNSLIHEGFDDQHPIASLVGLAADPDSKWVSLRLGELKIRLALAIGDVEQVLQGCDWVKYNGQLSKNEEQVYDCVGNLLQLDEPQNYMSALYHLYEKPIIEKAQYWLAGKDVFSDLPAPTLSLNGCELHQKLLQAYEKLHNAMLLHAAPQ